MSTGMAAGSVLTSRSWRYTPAMNDPRLGFAIATLGGKVYVSGGHTGTAYLSTTEVIAAPNSLYLVQKN